MRVAIFCLTVFLFTFDSVLAQTQPHAMDKIPVADIHIHLLDFLQNGGYLGHARFLPKRVKARITAEIIGPGIAAYGVNNIEKSIAMRSAG